MFGSSILDVAIGMAFIYLLLSLIASAMQEVLSAIVQARSANLEHGIRSLFSGGTLTDGTPVIEVLYNHGLIRGLYRDPRVDMPGSKAAVVVDSRLRSFLRWFLQIQPTPPINGVSDVFLLPSYIPARTFAVTLIDILNPDKMNGKPPLENIEAHLSLLCVDLKQKSPEDTHRLAQAILSLLADANTAKDAEQRFRANLENWYNDAMDRVSGWYKKYTQKILIVMGLLLAVAFNVDSIQVGKTLWFDKDMRQGLVSAAGTYVTDNTPVKNTDQAAAPATRAAGGANAAAPGAALDADGLKKHMETTVKAFNAVSTDYLLPVGWHYEKYTWADYRALLSDPSRWDPFEILRRLAGWIITALALSLGAPFWFDTLNKFMVVRSTVKPQEKSLNEVSKS